MSNKFTVTLTAVDKATAVIARMNERLGRTVRPVQRVGRSFAALGREMHLPALARGFGNASASAAKLARNVGASTASMEGLLGLGAAGAAGGVAAGIAAIGAGLVVLGAKVANAGYKVSQLSSLTGISTEALQRYAGAAKLMGGSGEDMQEAMANIGRSMRNAYYEGGPLLQFFNAAGIELRRTKDGAWDVEHALKKLADYSARTDITPQAKELAANMVGYVKVLPQMMKGADALEKSAKQAEKLGVVMGPEAIKNAEEYTEALARMTTAASGLGDKIGTKVYPVLEKLLRGTDAALFGTGLRDFVPEVNRQVRELLSGKRSGDGELKALPARQARGAAAEAPKSLVGVTAPGTRPIAPTVGSVAPFIPPPRSPMANGRLPPEIPVPAGLLSGAYPRPALPSDRDGVANVSSHIAKFAPTVPGKGSVEDYLAAADKQAALPATGPRSQPGQGGSVAQPAQTSQHTINVKFEGAPRGMTVSTTSSGGQPSSVKVTRSMADIDS